MPSLWGTGGTCCLQDTADVSGGACTVVHWDARALIYAFPLQSPVASPPLEVPSSCHPICYHLAGPHSCDYGLQGSAVVGWGSCYGITCIAITMASCCALCTCSLQPRSIASSPAIHPLQEASSLDVQLSHGPFVILQQLHLSVHAAVQTLAVEPEAALGLGSECLIGDWRTGRTFLAKLCPFGSGPWEPIHLGFPFPTHPYSI